MTEKTPSTPTEASESEKLRRHVRILSDLGRLAGQKLVLHQFLDQAVVQVARAIEVDHVKILRYRRKTADLFMEAGMGWKEGAVRMATFSSDMASVPGRSFQTAEPICIQDTSNAWGFVISDILKEHGIVSLANVPILLEGAAWGVLEVDSSWPRDFGHDTVEFMTAASAIIAATVQRHDDEVSEASVLAEAAAEAQRREILLRELQHRVKNNFQIILSSISIQKRRSDSSEAREELDRVSDRINAVSLAHDQLTPRESRQAVDVAAYLRALCASIEKQMENIVIEVTADEIALSIDRAIPLGLILNESVTNSVKHAFDGKGGSIFVKLKVGIGYGEARLTIADNGKGFNNPRPDGSGTKLILALVRQVGGKMVQDSSENGTTTVVTFPMIS
jgi:two-component sensor histidine kinase/putative methionine-R-sulfoxide reductase with GAF domain